MNADASSIPAIEVEKLQAGYDGDVVLQEVTFSVRRGEVFFIIGGSGCGKEVTASKPTTVTQRNRTARRRRGANHDQGEWSHDPSQPRQATQ